MNQFKNKVVLVTGGNSGIGLATAKLFHEEGAIVIVTARSKETFALAQKELSDKFHVIQADVSKVDDIKKLASSIKTKYGHLDVAFVNAGISQIRPIADFDEANYDSLFNTNVKGVYFTVQQIADLLVDGGSVVINASAAAHMGFPGGSVYGATKAALVAFARYFAAEYAPRKIRFNTISPSLIDTPIQTKLGLPPEVLKTFQDVSSKNPAGRIGEAHEVARSVLFLASDHASYVNGVDLLIDGGTLAVPGGF